jgi:DNA-binding NtrC family response regulator
MARILVVDDEEAMRSGLMEILHEEGHQTREASNGKEAMEKLRGELIDLVCSDLRMPGMDGLELLAQIKSESPETEVILITGYASISSAVEAVKLGAHDYLSKPFEIDEVRLTVERALEKKELRDRTRRLERNVKVLDTKRGLVGSSEVFRKTLSMVERIAPTPSTVLILGETGTGKELIAREIHEQSPRADKLFIPINCGALPDTLLESELFGHAKGAYTGADRASEGLFETADKGTLFLDEIGNISLNMQARLLRIIETGEFLRLGERKVRGVDVRIVAATNADLKAAVEDGRFRQDFYYRLNVVTLQLPPLRERRDDIAPLAEHFLEKCGAKLRKDLQGIAKNAMQALQGYSWPGNVRELENAIERAAILSVTTIIQKQDLPPELEDTPAGEIAKEPAALEDVERNHILRILKQTGGHRGKTAEILGINRRTLYRKLIEYGLDKGSLTPGPGDTPSQEG